MAKKISTKRKIIPTRISYCRCKSVWQDRRYGEGLRVFNYAPGSKGVKPDRYRCVVCGAEKEIYEKSE